MDLIGRLKFSIQSRRRFFQSAAVSAITLPQVTKAADTGANVLGPTPGYSPQIGTLVSEMAWMRDKVLRTVEGLSEEQLDFLLDDKANRIGALLMHLAATERLYQINTFENADPFKSAGFKEWAVAMELGAPARSAIKGHKLDYYLNALAETRSKTLAEFRKRDDDWLLAVDKKWPWGPTNTLCKWFHVCEHESHHNGQISLLKSRTPGAKSENG